MYFMYINVEIDLSGTSRPSRGAVEHQSGLETALGRGPMAVPGLS